MNEQIYKQVRERENERLANMTDEQRKKHYERTNKKVAELAKQIGIPIEKVKDKKK